ncbi:type III secretion system export apparatus subunit SctV [Caenimonas koreensis]|uniref:EscV/YscV/HrcV family type III secretion system export apparatus protein n=1 Tax=Caenimonas koreensis DSM 17982 TaxID=1121255 RepID=A0A844B1A5_9BURK|nr:type III secretion system export apparatus subunit SctV [Caenimonas koreensis]MRD47062.1 EscV/YscV/HrcV family type III secretion system export apparatus protein [Caenimonas koreensis DSM 17982]
MTVQAASPRLQRIVQALVSRNDLVLAALIVCIIFMMILPLPTWLMDVLIALNMCISAVLLMVAMYLPSPLAFSSFPSVLLITTLFRLAIGIATTRLILLNADAGHIVYTFGNFVVGGNLVVGLVVFLILTIVQFVVITKGAERVAEVGARFSLDAMPGKQMSIDGDMRAGVIDMDEARRRRTLVEKESQLYGSMDGAMKFVKGDAIAGLIIVAVNLLGGILIGTMQRGMTAAEAMKVYSILTIGDGLIAQIPALFISIGAGMIVTRVTTGDGPSNVGRDVGAQILSQPKALLIGTAVMVGFSAIPGMPTLTFLIVGALIGTLGYTLYKGETKVVDAKTGQVTTVSAVDISGKTGRPEKSKPGDADNFQPTVPLMVDVNADLEKVFSADMLNEELIKVRRALYFDLGVVFPGLQLRFNDQLPPESYSILVGEIPVSQGRLRADHLLVRESIENLSAMLIPHETDKKFLPNLPTIWSPAHLKGALVKAGIPFLEPTQMLSYHIAFVLRKHAAEFIGIQETRGILAEMEGKFAELGKEITRVMPIHKIAEILQRLVSEEVSIRNVRTVMEALVEWGQKEKDPVLLAEYVRMALRRYISHKYSSGQNMLPAYLLAPAIEDELRAAIRQTSAGSYLALDPSASKRITTAIKAAVGDPSLATQRPVLLTSMDIRRYMRKLLEQDLAELPVLSYQELTQEINIQPLARIQA